MSKILFFAPTSFEVPKKFQKKTKTFGMGEKKAQAIAQSLNALEDLADTWIVVFGCAGGLHPDLKIGDVFLVSEIRFELEKFEVALASSLTHLAKTTLVSSNVVASTREMKSTLRESSQCQMVDMEMFWIWKNASELLRSRLIFVRGVIDSSDDELEFVKPEGGLQKRALLKPKALKSLGRFLRNHKIYLAKMEKFLMEIESHLERSLD